MAETIENIENQIEAYANAEPELDALQNNTSLVSVWGKVKKVFAFATHALQLLFDKHKEEVQELIDNTEKGSLLWYLEQVKAFQYGDTLIVEQNQLVYENINPENQIVTQASIVETQFESGYSLLKIKAVKAGVGGLYEPLDPDEKVKLSIDLNKKKFAGTRILVESLPADVFYANTFKVRLDPLLYSIDGSLISSGGTEFPIKDALGDFLKNLSFDGVLFISKLTDAIQEVNGVLDVLIADAKLGEDGLDEEDAETFEMSIDSVAGHIVADSSLNIDYVL